MRHIRIPTPLLVIATLTSTMGALATPALAEENAHIYRSAYLLGRGDTGNALAEDEDAIFYNPAGLAIGKSMFKRLVLASPAIEASKNTKDLARQLAVEGDQSISSLRSNIGKPQHVGMYNFTGIVLRKAAFGAFTGVGSNALIFKSKDNGGLETLDSHTQATQGVSLSYADGFLGEHLLLGVTGKYMYRGESRIIAGIDSYDSVDPSKALTYGNGMGVDIGMLLRNETRFSITSFGLQVTDVGDTYFVTKDEITPVRPLPQRVNLGVALETGTPMSRFRLLADYRDVLKNEETNLFKRTHLGAEIAVLGLLGVTGGMNQGAPTVGMYFDMWLFRVDMAAYGEEVGEYAGNRTDLRYIVRIAAGL